jgi:hypothetical protein
VATTDAKESLRMTKSFNLRTLRKLVDRAPTPGPETRRTLKGGSDLRYGDVAEELHPGGIGDANRSEFAQSPITLR